MVRKQVQLTEQQAEALRRRSKRSRTPFGLDDLRRHISPVRGYSTATIRIIRARNARSTLLRDDDALIVSNYVVVETTALVQHRLGMDMRRTRCSPLIVEM